MKTLVTNDDGVHSEGLISLARMAASRGLDVTVVAPSFDASGSSASMTAVASDGKVMVDTVGGDGPITVLAVEAPPAFIVRAAIYGAFGAPPELILSGINRGPNAGRAVLHSGTVGAALTASNYGRRALAISAELDDDDGCDPEPGIIGAAIDWIIRSPLSTVLNVNVPADSRSGVGGVRATTLADSGTVQGSVAETAGGFVSVTFADGGPAVQSGTDSAALSDGCVSVTAIRAVTEDAGLDVAGLFEPADA